MSYAFRDYIHHEIKDRMERINHILGIMFVFIGLCSHSQTIVINACHSLIEDQDYTFNQKMIDTTGRNIFETNPIDENSPCGGIGNCEFQIAWNQTQDRWEIVADDGNGTFSNTYVLFYNTEASTPNPPSLTLGAWTEETSVTQSMCGTINSITGAVQNSTLGLDDINKNGELSLSPNPATGSIQILGLTKAETYKIYNVIGVLVHSGKVSNNDHIDIENLRKGIYFLKFDHIKSHRFIKI